MLSDEQKVQLADAADNRTLGTWHEEYLEHLVERIASDAARATERALVERVGAVLDEEQSALLPDSNAAIWSEVWSKHVRAALASTSTEGGVNADRS